MRRRTTRRPRRLKVLIGCEFSGAVRRQFRRRGHDAWSCDRELAADASPYHYHCDVFDAIQRRRWDLAIFHPPCTFLTVAANKWFYHPDDRHLACEDRRPHPDYPRRRQDQREALEFVQRLLDADIPHIALENPVGVISTQIRKWTQLIQPYQFGDDASKKTCLWLKELPPLEPTLYIPPRIVGGKERWGNQTDSGQNRLGPSDDRAAIRSTTYRGIAEAMASQWSAYLLQNG